ncbi:MAG: Rossmann-like fold-containing protein [Pseudomonadota bacterium]
MHKTCANYRTHLATNLYNFSTKVYDLTLRYINHGMMSEARELHSIAASALAILKAISKSFNFVQHLASGSTLMVGEGNLSFTLSLTKTDLIDCQNIIATTFEKEIELSDAAMTNSKLLRKHGVNILHGIDATELSNTFGNQLFDNTVFQFPNAGSREPIYGRNPNFVLVRDFLISARKQLSYNGTALISAIDSPYYEGAFQFEEAASIAGFVISDIYPFDPLQFEGYEHTMTHQDGGAIDKNDKCVTWIFTKK